MEYKFKCSVDLGSFCCGGGCDYEGFFTVDLSDSEVEAIRNSDIDWENSEDVMSDLKSKQPDIAFKILIEAWSIGRYAAVRDCRISGMWQDAQEDDDIEVDEEELMEYDIDYRGFDPVDAKGRRLSFADAYNMWVDWEDEQLDKLPYDERTEFYTDRYNLPEIETDGIGYEIEFPDELKH